MDFVLKPVITKDRDTINPSISGMITALSNKNQLLQTIGQEFARQTKENFGSAGRYRSAPWASYSPQYSKAVGSSTPTLIKTGRLENSIQVGVPSNNSISVSTQVPYAEMVAFGRVPRNFWPVLMSGKTATNMVPRGETDLINALIKTLSRLSSGAFSVNV